jgi:hypothetical protein
MLILGSVDAATWALVGVTAALVVVTGVLAVSTWNSANKAGEAAEAAVRTAVAAENDLTQGATLVRVGQDQVEIAQKQAAAALKQSDIANQTLLNSFRPLLVPVVERKIEQRLFYGLDGVSVELQMGPEPKAFIGRDLNAVDRFFVIVPLRNIGPGCAILSGNVVDAAVVPYGGGTRIYGKATSPIVAPNDTVDFVFYGVVDEYARSIASAAPGGGRLATLTIRYFDVSGSNASKTVLLLGSRGAPMLSVEDLVVDLHEGSPT